jgi:folate-dependent phosphoribosylglycinamide formyltransferase PurN
MKIIIIIDETPFFHPNFLDHILQNSINKNFKVGIVRRIPKKSNLNLFFMRNILCFSLREILLLSIKKNLFYILNIFFPKGLKKTNFSVVGVCKKHNIKFFYINDNINNSKYIKIIKNFIPNLVISSNSLIFSKELLNLNDTVFVNRHTSLLPTYKGLLPVVHAIINNEDKIGVSLHTMETNIDCGNLLAQEQILLNNEKNLHKIYDKAFKISSTLTLKVIENVEMHKSDFIKNDLKSSYYSFPSKSDLKKFKAMGGNFI